VDFVNRVWLEFAGQTLDFIRSHPGAWMTAVHPEDRERAARTFWKGVNLGQGFAFETRSRRAKDGIYRWHLQQAVVLRDAEGKILRFVGTTTDIDDQKRAEQALRQIQAHLAHVARVATLNTMTASIAHEVNQPLGAILLNADTCVRMLAADPSNVAGATETARRTIQDAKRAAEVIQRLRAMFSTAPLTLETTNLNDVAREVFALATAELRWSGARLQTELAEDLPAVSIDRVQLQQVILNLLLNAAEAMHEVADRPRTVVVKTGLDTGGGVRLDVRDAGTGFDAGAAERLFEAFYTTKTNGMGIGLSICRSIIESHNGRLWAAPNDGPGATFSFSIPATSRQRP
jgi:PAS domain S-box-containing protein